MKIKQFSLESSCPQDAWTPIRLKAWLQVAKWGRYTVMILGEWIITYAVLYTSVYFCWLKVLSAFSCESKIRAIESKLKLMESGCDHKTTFQGKHPLLVQSERTRSHPYKKEERYSRGRGKHGRWQTLLPDAILMKESFLNWGTDCFRNGILFWNLNNLTEVVIFLVAQWYQSCCRSSGADFRSLQWQIGAFWMVFNWLGFAIQTVALS